MCLVLPPIDKIAILFAKPLKKSPPSHWNNPQCWQCTSSLALQQYVISSSCLIPYSDKHSLAGITAMGHSSPTYHLPMAFSNHLIYSIHVQMCFCGQSSWGSHKVLMCNIPTVTHIHRILLRNTRKHYQDATRWLYLTCIWWFCLWIVLLICISVDIKF